MGVILLRPAMYPLDDGEYSESVYDDTWEDLGVLCETWKALHGVDSVFCRNVFRQYANHLDQEKQ